MKMNVIRGRNRDLARAFPHHAELKSGVSHLNSGAQVGRHHDIGIKSINWAIRVKVLMTDPGKERKETDRSPTAALSSVIIRGIQRNVNIGWYTVLNY
jgi:hypothetical protein